MADLEKTIQKDLVDAQKNKDQEKVDTLRLVMSEIKNKRIDSGKDLKDNEVQSIVQKEIKKRNDSIKAFKDGGREELAKKEEQEIAIIEKYLPAQMSEADVKKAVLKINKDNSDLDFGPLMGKVMQELKDKADGALVKDIVSKEIKK